MKTKTATSVIICLTLIVIGLTVYIFYSKSNVTKCPETNEISENDNIKSKEEKSDVPTSDKYATFLNIESNVLNYQNFILDNGKLYYKIADAAYNENYIYYTEHLEKNNIDQLTEYKDLKNIKRIKSGNTISTGVDFNILAITEEGKVYNIYYDFNEKKFSQYEETIFNDYKVDDIIYYNAQVGCVDGMDCSSSFKIKTTDGEITEK